MRVRVGSIRQRRRFHNGVSGEACRNTTPFDVWRSVAISASARSAPDLTLLWIRASGIRRESNSRSGAVSSSDSARTRPVAPPERQIPGPPRTDLPQRGDVGEEHVLRFHILPHPLETPESGLEVIGKRRQGRAVDRPRTRPNDDVDAGGRSRQESLVD